MYLFVTLLTLAIIGMILAGFYLHFNPLPAEKSRRWMMPTVGGNIVLFLGAQLSLMALGISDATAEPAVQEALAGQKEVSVGLGLALIGAALPTALSTIAAGIAVGPIGAASLAAVAEKPEIFGRTLVYLGLAEGIAIYGLVLSILILDRV